MGGWLAGPLGISRAEQQLDVVRIHPKVVLAGEQIIERLGIRLGMRPWFDLLVGVLTHADEHDIRMRTCIRGPPWQGG